MDSDARLQRDLHELDDLYSAGGISRERYEQLKANFLHSRPSAPSRAQPLRQIQASAPTQHSYPAAHGASRAERRLNQLVFLAVGFLLGIGAAMAVAGVVHERGTLLVSLYEPGAGREPLIDSHRGTGAPVASGRGVDSGRGEEVDGDSGGAAEPVDPNAFDRGLVEGRAIANAGFQNPTGACQADSRRLYRDQPSSQGLFLQGCIAGASGG